ncbi:hypothetical protein [Agrilactobacillus composti]|nr:hypothetical protein [Agrilactobacillus composti]
MTIKDDNLNPAKEIAQFIIDLIQDSDIEKSPEMVAAIAELFTAIRER